jgi:hypothetical protein
MKNMQMMDMIARIKPYTSHWHLTTKYKDEDIPP